MYILIRARHRVGSVRVRVQTPIRTNPRVRDRNPNIANLDFRSSGFGFSGWRVIRFGFASSKKNHQSLRSEKPQKKNCERKGEELEMERKGIEQRKNVKENESTIFNLTDLLNLLCKFVVVVLSPIYFTLWVVRLLL